MVPDDGKQLIFSSSSICSVVLQPLTAHPAPGLDPKTAPSGGSSISHHVLIPLERTYRTCLFLTSFFMSPTSLSLFWCLRTYILTPVLKFTQVLLAG